MKTPSKRFIVEVDERDYEQLEALRKRLGARQSGFAGILLTYGINHCGDALAEHVRPIAEARRARLDG